MKKFITSILFFLLITGTATVSKASAFAENKNVSIVLINSFLETTDTLKFQIISVSKDSLILPSKKEIRKKKFVSALFAFPFPFGFMGAHRVMLGTKPWIPIIYAATFGGCFGIIPMIDFFVIVFSKDMEQYENNPRLFMWIK